MEKKFLTVQEVSKITGLSPHSVRNRVKTGVFKTLPRKQNEKILISAESLISTDEKVMG